jgi:hypothetical protein
METALEICAGSIRFVSSVEVYVSFFQGFAIRISAGSFWRWYLRRLLRGCTAMAFGNGEFLVMRGCDLQAHRAR